MTTQPSDPCNPAVELDARKHRVICNRIREQLRTVVAGSDVHILQQLPSSQVLVELRVQQSSTFRTVWHVLARIAESVEFAVDQQSISDWELSGVCYLTVRINVITSRFWSPEDEREYQVRKESLLRDVAGAGRGYVYFISDGEFIKIGRSDDYPIGRIGSLQTANARDLKLLAVIPGADRECHLHRLFSAHHVRREWFRSCREILDYIEAIPQT